MNFFGARKLIGEETKELNCIRCGDRPNIVQVMFDPRRGGGLARVGASPETSARHSRLRPWMSGLPRKRTSGQRIAKSARCQQETHALQQNLAAYSITSSARASSEGR